MNKVFKLVLFLFSIPLSAQPGLKVEELTPKDGLSYRWVMSMIQDKKGFLWIGTYDGLNRYDGSEFSIYRQQKGDSTTLQNNVIYGIEEDQSGQLWIATETGFNLYDPVADQFTFYQPGKDSFHLAALPNRVISSRFFPLLPEMMPWLKEESELPDGQRSTIAQNSVLSRLKNTYQDNIRLITKIEEKTYWLWMTNGNYIRYDIKQAQWTNYDLKQLPELKIIHEYLPIDDQGRFWFPSKSSTVRDPFDFLQLPDGISLASWEYYFVDNRYNIWLKTVDSQLFRYDIEDGKLQYLGEYDVDFAFEDKEGITWAGHDLGLIKITESKRLFENYLTKSFNLGETAPVGVSCREMVELANGRVILREQINGRLFELDPVTQTSTTFELLSGYPSTHAILYTDMERLWLTSPRYGLYRQSLKEDTYATYPNSGESYILQQDQKDRVWLADLENNGEKTTILVFDKSDQQFRRLQTYPGSITYAYLEKQKDILWAAYQRGLLRIDTETEIFEYIELNVFEGSDVFGEGNVWSILPWQGHLWLGSAEGLLQFDPTSKQVVRQYTIQDGLPNNRVYSILSAGENLWLGTHNGLCRFNPETLSAKNFYVEDGLSNNEFNRKSALKAKDGKLWFGGLNGVNAFYPKGLENLEQESAELIWTKYSKYNLTLDTLVEQPLNNLVTNPTFTNRPNEQEFTFHFALLSYIDPSRHQYNWYLEGIEKEWSQTSNKPIAFYRNIPPGTYTFRARALDHTGYPAQNELSTTITISQVWYKRWWAWSLYVMAFLVCSYLFYRFRLNRHLIKQESLRLKEIDEVKTKLYTNITHEFRTPLTVVLGMAEQINATTADQLEVDKITKASGLILRNGQNLLNLVNRMLDLSKLESGKMPLNLVHADVIPYLNYLVESFHSFAALKNIQLHFLPNVQDLKMDYDPEKIQHLVSNLLSNAIKFTPDGGNVYVTVEGRRQTAEGNALLLKVKDTGIGISQKKLPHIFDRFYQADDSATRTGEGTGIGLALVRELVKLMHGEINVTSSLTKGTEFSIVLPVEHKASDLGVKDSEMDVALAYPVSKVDTLGVFAQPEQITENTLTHSSSLPTLQLLLIEDNPDIAHYIQSCLENQYQITYAQNGQEGIDKAIELIPDTIISDVMMPIKDGLEVVQTLKNDERTSHIPIILLTAKADVASKIEGLESGADAYLAKPFNPKELQIRLQKGIELRMRLQKKYANITALPPTNESSTSSQETTIEDAFLHKLKTIVESKLSNADFNPIRLARALGLSQAQMYRKVKALTATTPALFIRKIRLHKGRALLRSTNLTVSEIAYEVGFSDPNYFSRTFSEEFGHPPNENRK